MAEETIWTASCKAKFPGLWTTPPPHGMQEKNRIFAKKNLIVLNAKRLELRTRKIIWRSV